MGEIERAIPIILVASATICAVASTIFTFRRINSHKDPARSGVPWLKICWSLVSFVWLPLLLAIYCIELVGTLSDKERFGEDIRFLLRALQDLMSVITMSCVLTMQLELAFGLRRVANPILYGEGGDRTDKMTRLLSWLFLATGVVLALVQLVISQLGGHLAKVGVILQSTVNGILLVGAMSSLVFSIVVSRAAKGPVGRVVSMQLVTANILTLVRETCSVVYGALTLVKLWGYRGEDTSLDVLDSVTTVWTVLGGLWLAASITLRRGGGLWSVDVKGRQTPCGERPDRVDSY